MRMNIKLSITIVILLLLAAGAVWYLKSSAPLPGGVACTMEALVCPDGSAVGRQGPSCTFTACPNQESFEGELRKDGGRYRLIIAAPEGIGTGVTYAMPLVVSDTTTADMLLGKTVTIRGVFTEGSTLSVQSIAEASPEVSGFGNNVKTIGIGETKFINGVTITLHSIVQDFRCPIDDPTCPEGGGVAARVTFKSDTDSETFTMPSDEVPRPFDSFQVSIVKIDPPLLRGQTPDPGAYRISFKVEPLPANVRTPQQ